MNANGTISLLLGAGDTHRERRQNCYHIIKLRPAQQGARQQSITLTRRINLHPAQSHAIALECITNGASGTLNDRGGLTKRQFMRQFDKFEHVERGTLSHLLGYLATARVQGEYVLVVAGAAARAASIDTDDHE